MKSKYDELLLNVKKNFAFAESIKYYANLLMQVEEAKKYIAYFICLDNYAERLIAYSTFTYADLLFKNTIILPKSDANRIYLRGCVEACFIINILLNNYKLADKFMSNIKADIKKINYAYKDSSLSRKEIYKDYYNEDLEGIKYERRYSWLPRLKHKKPANISDLINYLRLDDENKKRYFEMNIRSLDNYSHPSFYIPSMFHNPRLNSNFKEIFMLYDKGGIIEDCNRIVIDSLHAFLNNIDFSSRLDFLDLMNEKYEIKDSNVTSVRSVNEYVLNYSNEFSKEDVCRFLWRRYDVNTFYMSHVRKYPTYIGNITMGLSLLIDYLKSINDNSRYKLVNTIMLLEDALLRYEEFLKSYTTNYITSFYVQSRYLIEFITTLNILLNEDEKRSHIYFMHQDIKSFQYKQNIYNFVKLYDNLTIKAGENIAKIEKKQEEDVKFIHDYYLNEFNMDIDDRSIARLNGWAINLKGLNNDAVLNLPFLLTFSINDLTKDIKDSFTSFNLIDFGDFVAGFYEEACAYSHVTPYAFFNNLKIYNSNALVREQFIVINLLIIQLYNKISEVFELDEEKPDIKRIDALLISSLTQLIMSLKK